MSFGSLAPILDGSNRVVDVAEVPVRPPEKASDDSGSAMDRYALIIGSYE